MSVQATFCATLVDEWARRGVTEAVVCPGSRSTPLALSLAERFRTHVRLDERSAGFYALGLAAASGRPVVVCVTSGTAAAELLASVVEAHHAGVPLIVCTADRPPELHDTGANQTIEQAGLFASVARWASAPGVPEEGQAATWRPLAARSFAEAIRGAWGPGPVHLNLAFREPLVGAPGELPARPGPAVEPGPAPPCPGLHQPLGGRGILVVGGLAARPAGPAGVLALAEGLRWPVLADPLSGCRVPGTIAAADAIVRTGAPQPDTVVLLGAPWLSKALDDYVAGAARAGARVVVVDPWRHWPDPSRVASEFHQADTDAWLSAALEGASACEPAWLEGWRRREASAQAAIDEALGTALSEPQVARAVHRHAAARGATVVVSASMPIRDLEWFAAPEATPPRVLANRGANGIDGVVSTAAGVAAASPGGPGVLALLGDLAFLHDVSGLVGLPDVPCTFVVVDNGGGGIFSFLPQAGSLEAPRFEQLFGTPPTNDVAAVARGFGLEVREVAALGELAAALEGRAPAVVRVRVPDRRQNVALHQALEEAVRRALA
ncbi:MAG TPA: 2-succinyl-5-enolpyruvyl-6-hydroxy-3-cyclohexene-1-carboxylic-acid synthase [Acidimicrobiales bacterium]|nr:2-succinyl-5-enolpyruvyl-6-hydroxy-3-cyclohexene-1-carboxylic-acid synthase [Acidimicrobiales bacterium]